MHKKSTTAKRLTLFKVSSSIANRVCLLISKFASNKSFKYTWMYELNGNLSPNWLRRKKKTVDGDDYMRKEMSSERPTIILFDTLIYKSTARWMDGVPCCHVCFVCVWEWVARKNKIKKYSRRKENNRQVKEMQKCVSEARLKVLLINSNKEIREKKNYLFWETEILRKYEIFESEYAHAHTPNNQRWRPTMNGQQAVKRHRT